MREHLVESLKIMKGQELYIKIFIDDEGEGKLQIQNNKGDRV